MQGEILRKGPWLEEEDRKLKAIVTLMGNRKWDYIAKASGLKRSGKSCRLRWMNYLRPNLKHGHISIEEEQTILRLQKLWGNKWSKIARWLPGRTDNEIKNYWRTHLKRKAEVLEKENDNSSMNRVNENASTQHRYISIEASHGEQKSIQDLEAQECAINTLTLSELAYIESPYPTRLFDWISETSGGYETDCNNVASYLCVQEDNNISPTSTVWDYACPLWDDSYC